MSAAAKQFQGVFPFILTPTKVDGNALDLDALGRFIDFQIDSGVAGVFGSTGGIGSYSEEERKAVIEAGAKHINRGVALVAGTGSARTPEAVRFSAAKALQIEGPFQWSPPSPDRHLGAAGNRVVAWREAGNVSARNGAVRPAAEAGLGDAYEHVMGHDSVALRLRQCS
jgi:hypothetical protein